MMTMLFLRTLVSIAVARPV